MIEEMDTRRSNIIEEVSAVMEASKSRGSVRRSRDEDVSSSSTGKRRRFDFKDHENVVDLDSQRRRVLDLNFPENVVLSGKFDHVSSSRCSSNDSSFNPEDERLHKTEIVDGFSRETVLSSEICLGSVEMESSSSSSSSSTSRKKQAATSRCKPPPASEFPSAAEIEEFFAEAEKYEQKRFAEKYNYDTVNDVPLEGRYQWVRLKP